MFSLAALHYSSWGWVAIISGAFAIGLNKGGLAGLGILPVLIFAFVLQAKESTGYILPLLIIGDLCAIGIYWRVVIWKVFWLLLPPALLGVFLGYCCMNRIDGAAYAPLIGWIIIALIALQLSRKVLGEKIDHIFDSRGFGLFMGVLAGFTTMIANAAGPVAIFYLISVRLPKWNLIGTSAWFFFIINLCKVPFSASLGLTNASSLSLAFCLAPIVVIGFFLGRWAAAAMPQKGFESFVLVCTALGALKLVW
jgi:uncharacterized membrane protein YfcA